MKATNTIQNTMEEKRKILLDNCTRALCGDSTIDKKLMDEATGGRFTNGNGETVDQEQIKTLLLALRWLGLPIEAPVKKRRTTRKAAGNGAQPVVKRRGRPKGTKNSAAPKKKRGAKSPDETSTETPLEAKVDVPPATKPETPVETKTETPVETKTETPVETKTETPTETVPAAAMQGSLDGVTFEGGSLSQ